MLSYVEVVLQTFNMHQFLHKPTLHLLLLCGLCGSTIAQSTSPKRGLVYIGNNNHAASDASIWRTNTDLTWYYNYGHQPTPELTGSALQFVPMLHGQSQPTFKDDITSRKRSGEAISAILGFNEPDMKQNVGGSDISPSDAAKLWIDQIEPLKQLGIRVGAPAVSGSPIGFAWLSEWEKACNAKCNPDFLPMHWYGTFDAFTSWVANMSVTYPALDLWVTEFGLPGGSLDATRAFFNQSINLLDTTSNVTHYAYFGAVRSKNSNIGGNAAMLSNGGELTDVGSWYLGRNATGVQPSSSSATSPHHGHYPLFIILSSLSALMLAS